MRYVFLTLCHLWTLPNTVAGLALVSFSSRFMGMDVNGVFHFVVTTGGWLDRWFRKSNILAFALGCVVTYESEETYKDRRVRAHELEHIRQFMLLGIFMLPLYYSASLYMALRKRQPYWENPFERAARARAARITNHE